MLACNTLLGYDVRYFFVDGKRCASYALSAKAVWQAWTQPTKECKESLSVYSVR